MLEPILVADSIGKQFPGVIALDGVSMQIAAGECLAVVGENGAGKSTLMKILAGVYQPDSGTIRCDGKIQQFRLPSDALVAGVALIHQELNLAENLDVAANIFLGRERTVGGPLKLLARRSMAASAMESLQQVGLPASIVRRTVSALSPGQKQLVEIARALSMSARVIIMDEPTSSLTQGETNTLYKVIDTLKANGTAIIYISHRLAEVKRVADRVTVLRDGRNAGELPHEEINHDNMVRHMVGRDLKQIYNRNHNVEAAANPLFEVHDLTYEGGPATPVSFTINPGEILGMAGLVGAGRTELAEAIFGIRPITSGSVTLDCQSLTIRCQRDAIHAGIALVPEDRRLHGLVLEESCGDNVSLPNLPRLSWFGLLKRGQIHALAQTWIERLRVRTPSVHQPVGLLSGGNQQKIVFAKWLARTPRLLILDEPTRGVDVGARSEIYTLIDECAANGAAIWMISSDMEEVLGLSDRIAVLHQGAVAGIVNRADFQEETIMRLATGAE